MKRFEIILISFFFVGLVGVFFYKTFLFGLIPFPGDLLIAEYTPWKTYSYNGYTPGSYPNKAQYFDTLRQLYPWITFSTHQWKIGQIPLWNPYNFSGSPLLANSQSAVLYPLHILFLLFPQHIAWAIYIILQPLFAGIFTYMYAKKIGMNKIGSLFASVSFSFSLFMSVFLEYGNIGHAFLWLPFLLYLVESILKKPIKKAYLVLFIVALLSCFLAGHIQIFGFIFSFLLVYIIYRTNTSEDSKKQKMRNAFLFFLLIVASIGISSIQLVPTLELIKNSARVSQSYEFLIKNLLIQPQQLILFLSPDFYGNPATRNYVLQDSYPGNALYIGFIPFLFSIFAIFRYKKNKLIKFYFICSIILLFLFIRTPITEFIYRFNIPLISTGSPTNAIFLLSFFLGILGGFGIQDWILENKKRHYVLPILFLALFVVIFITELKSNGVFSKNNFLYSSLLLCITTFLLITASYIKHAKKIIVIILLVITIGDLFYFFQKFNPFVPSSFIYPDNKIFTYLQSKKGIDRVWGYGYGAIEANIATQFSLYSPDGYDPLYPKRYGEFIQASKNGTIETDFTNATRSDAVIAPGFGDKSIAENRYRLQILRLLGVKYILDRQNANQTFGSEDFRKLLDEDGWNVYENSKAIPRISLIPGYKVFHSKEEFEKIFFSNDFNMQKTILLEEAIPQFVSGTDQKGLVKLFSYTPNKIIIETRSIATQFLFLSDVFYPGWHSYIDGKEVPIYRANYAFRAVINPKGNHTIIFEYLPQSFSLGVTISIISSLCGILFIVFSKKLRVL